PDAAGTPSVAAGAQRPPAQHAPAPPPQVSSRPPPATSQPAPGAPPPRSSTPTGGGTPPAAGFRGTIHIQFPGLGNTLPAGQNVYGSVTDWSAGLQVWLFVRPETSILETPEGPCRVAGTTWTCPNVQLPGLPGTREHLDVIVVPSATTISSNLPTLPV